jgi:hypothetical protein
MSAVGTGSAKTLDIGAVVQDGLGALGRNFLGFTVLAVLLHGIPTALMDLSQFFPGNSASYFVFIVIGVVIDAVGYAILMGALIYGTMRDLEGRRAPILACLAVGRRHGLRLLGLAILVDLALALGLLLLIVPGVLLMLRWAVASSALVMEGRGIQDAMGRSAALTENRRWSILLLFLVFFVVAYGAQWCVNLVARGFSVPQIEVRIALSSAVSVISALLNVTVFAALFRQLRGDPEGGPPDALAEVFA